MIPLEFLYSKGSLTRLLTEATTKVAQHAVAASYYVATATAPPTPFPLDPHSTSRDTTSRLVEQSGDPSVGNGDA